MSNLQKHHRRVWRIQIVIKINEILENLISDFAVIKDNTLFTEIVCDYQKFLKRVMDFYFQGHIGNAALEMKTYIEDLIDGSKGIAFSNIKNSIAFNDKEIIIRCAKETKKLISIEDHNVIGGLGSAIAEVLTEEYPKELIRLGVKDTFGKSGKAEELMEHFKITAKDIVYNFPNNN